MGIFGFICDNFGIIATLTVAAITLYYMTKKHVQLPPGPVRLPLLGNLHQVIWYSPMHEYLDQLVKKYGPVIRLDFGVRTCIIINGVEQVNEALVKKQDAFAGRMQSWTSEMMSQGYKDIVNANYSATWLQQKKLAHTAFRHFVSKDMLVETLHKSFGSTAALIDGLNGEALDPKEYIYNMVFQANINMSYGRNLSLDDSELTSLREMLATLAENGHDGYAPDYIPFLRHLPRTSAQKNFLMLWNKVVDYAHQQFRDHKQIFDKDNIKDICDELISAFQSSTKEEIQGLGDDNLAHTTLGVFAANTDTIAVTLRWLLLLMAVYPEIQTKAQQEIEDTLGSDVKPDYHKCKNALIYCQAIIHEAMRIRSVSPLGLPHETMSDTSVDGYDVPKGTLVFINLYALHHDTKYWEEPDSFIPERFLEDNMLQTKLPSYMPFSTGRRSCIGESIAKVAVFMLFTCLLQRYRISFPVGKTCDLQPGTDNPSVMQPKPHVLIMSKR